MEERIQTNYDQPSAVDHNLLFQHLQILKSGQAIEVPLYSYAEHMSKKEMRHLEPKR